MENPFEAMRATLLERGWTQHAFTRSDGSLCLVGAVRAVRSNPQSWGLTQQGRDPVLQSLKEHAGVPCVSYWNDKPDRTFNDVMELLDECSRDWKLEHGQSV